MSRLTPFDSPFLLGFDHLERMLDRVSRSANDGYPPYNIEQTGENHLRITVAVAGFTLNDLSVSQEQNQLIIRGRKEQAETEEKKNFLHRGIATRQFQRAFVLSDEMVIEGAALDNGLLHIDLKRVVPETLVRNIEIKNAGGEKANGKSKMIQVEKEKPACCN